MSPKWCCFRFYILPDFVKQNSWWVDAVGVGWLWLKVVQSTLQNLPSRHGWAVSREARVKSGFVSIAVCSHWSVAVTSCWWLGTTEVCFSKSFFYAVCMFTAVSHLLSVIVSVVDVTRCLKMLAKFLSLHFCVSVFCAIRAVIDSRLFQIHVCGPMECANVFDLCSSMYCDLQHYI